MLKKKKERNNPTILLLLTGIILFSLSFPGILNREGVSILAFIAIFPVYYSIRLMSYREAVFFGFIYGAGNYLLFNYWLAGFDPVSFSVAPTIIGLYHVILFLLCRFIYNNFSRFIYIPLTLTWLLYEVFKGENIIGYTYGTLAHSMYKTHIFTGIADITGTYIISLIIIFPSIFAASLLHSGIKTLKKREIIIPISTYLSILLASILYTDFNTVNYSNSPTIRTSLIQHNMDCWLNGTDELYSQSLNDLLDLSIKAQRDNPDLVLWSETAFVPAIEWHKEHKTNMFRYELVEKMENHFADYSNNYIIGANEYVGLYKQEKFNSVYHYKNGLPLNKYRKIKLVPFTEYFPYPKMFPLLYRYTVKLGAKHYLPGKKQINFNINGINATPLICYEDTFSDLARSGVLNGGDILINFTNDAWSTESSCTLQHLAAAVFRSIENRRSFIRVGTGGYSCIIDPNGKIVKSLPILTKSQLTFDVPIYNNHITFYTRYGNLIEKLMILIFALIIIIKGIRSIRPVQLLKKRLK